MILNIFTTQFWHDQFLAFTLLCFVILFIVLIITSRTKPADEHERYFRIMEVKMSRRAYNRRKSRGSSSPDRDQ